MRFRKIQQGSWWWLGKLCEVPRCYFEGDWCVIVLCTMFLVSCISFNKCLHFSYYMAGYLLDSPCTIGYLIITFLLLISACQNITYKRATFSVLFLDISPVFEHIVCISQYDTQVFNMCTILNLLSLKSSGNLVLGLGPYSIHSFHHGDWVCMADL